MWVDQRGSEVLPRGEALRLLAIAARRGMIGRLAISTYAAPLVQPVSFEFTNGLVVARIGAGFIGDVVPGHLVAFEVDGIDSASGAESGMAWSVLVRGLASIGLPEDAAGGTDHPTSAAAVRTDTHIVSIRPDVVAGRRFSWRVRDTGDARTSRPNRRAVPHARGRAHRKTA